MATKNFSFTSPLGGPNNNKVPTYKIWVSGTAVTNAKMTVKVTNTSKPKSVSVTDTSTGGNALGVQFMNRCFQIPKDTLSVPLAVEITDKDGSTVDIKVHPQTTATGYSMAYVVVTANDSGSDDDYQDVV